MEVIEFSYRKPPRFKVGDKVAISWNKNITGTIACDLRMASVKHGQTYHVTRDGISFGWFAEDELIIFPDNSNFSI